MTALETASINVRSTFRLYLDALAVAGPVCAVIAMFVEFSVLVRLTPVVMATTVTFQAWRLRDAAQAQQCSCNRCRARTEWPWMSALATPWFRLRDRYFRRRVDREPDEYLEDLERAMRLAKLRGEKFDHVKYSLRRSLEKVFDEISRDGKAADARVAKSDISDSVETKHD